MKLLLDTHAFIWWDQQPEKLSARVRRLIESGTNAVYVSIASIWEIQIKLAIGKLTLNRSLPETVTVQQAANGLNVLPIGLAHLWTLARLADLHRDPFDRMLLAQAKFENMRLLSRDSDLKRYGVELIW